MNDELRQRSEALNQLNDFLESMFTSLRSGLAVLDRELRVTVWNRQAQELWGVRREEAEQVHFFSLDIGLPLPEIAHAMRACLAGTIDRHEVILPALNRRGRAIACKISLFPLVGREGDRPRGVIVLMDDQSGTSVKEDGTPAAPHVAVEAKG